MSRAELVLARAASFLGVTEDPPHLNRGPEIDGWNHRVGNQLGDPWCAAFAWCMGADVLGDAWPVVKSGGCQAIYEWASAKGIVRVSPAAGDLFLLYFPSLARYAHTGYVTRTGLDTIATTEANTNPNGGREGYGVFTRARTVTPRLAFVRWTSLLSEG